MRYKAVFIDVDGTLLDDNLQITPGTKEILNRLHQNNTLIVIVTARPPSASLRYYDELGITGNPIICFNGALILHAGKILHEEIVSTKDCLRILQEAGSFDISLSLYKRQDWFAEKVDYRTAQEIEITQTRIQTIPLTDLLGKGFESNKILCMGEPSITDAFESHLLGIGFNALSIHKSKPTYLEITNVNASKAAGINILIGLFGVDKDEVIAIGDNFNDIEMLKFAGMGIAMGNAPDEVKAVADTVTITNNEEGIQKALETLHFE